MRPLPNPLPVVCVAVGDVYGRAETYITRMNSMLQRHCPVPFQLVCYSDVARDLPAVIEVRDCASWLEEVEAPQHITNYKLGLFSADNIPFEQFLYLDLSLIIRRDMSDLLDFAFNSSAALAIVNEWHYPCYNSSVMRIRRGELQEIYDAFIAGKRHPQRIPGDQDFVYAQIGQSGLREQVALFPAEQIISYKNTRTLNRSDREAAQERIEAATIVKFHGRPKMHQVANPLYKFYKPKDKFFFSSGLNRDWR